MFGVRFKKEDKNYYKIMEYFTRLTPNSFWESPIGLNGKCNSSDINNPLYEETNHFGWEEWLLKDYHNEQEICYGFVQALNGQNLNINSIDLLHLYTRECINGQAENYYVGSIKNVQVLPIDQRRISDEEQQIRQGELLQAGIFDFPLNDIMWNNSQNIKFASKDVTFHPNFREYLIQLNRGQFRFCLYNLLVHPNFTMNINQHVF